MDRNRKRSDAADHLHADKRACSSSGFRPSTSSSAAMDEPSPANYVSCHSDESDHSESDHSHDDEYMDHHRCGPTRVKFERLVDAISAGGADDPSAKLAALSELCEVLSFCVEDALAFFPIDAGVPSLVRLAGAEGYPDAALLAARALTYLCDAMPRSADALVRHGAVTVLCSRLLTIEYLDLAEQCLQALEKISKKQPVPCLQAGTITAVLSYIDFFSTSIQRVALSTVANICKKLPLDCSHLILESVPTICNILQYEDRKLIETAAICLIRIAECFYTSTEILDELCKHGVINQVLQLVSAGRTTLGPTTYKGLVGFLTKLAGGSLVATKTLYGLNLSSTLRGMLVASDFSNGSSYSLHNDSQSSQVHEILKLLHQLIPSVASDVEDIQMVLAKEKILAGCPMFIRQISVDILPLLIEVVNSGASFSVCYGCVSVINNAVYFCGADEFLELIKTTNISSFLAGLLARKDHHILYSTLKIVEILLQKLPSVFTCSFIKEGVIYAVDALLALEDRSESVAHKSSPSQPSGNRPSSGDASRCLCYAFGLQKSSPSDIKTCRVGKDSVLNIAKQIKATSFADNSAISEVVLTENFQKLTTLCAILCDSRGGTLNSNCSAQSQNYLSSILDQVLRELRGGDGMSTFEFIESGIMRSLSCYLTNGKYLHSEFDDDDLKGHFFSVLKRLQIFTSMSMVRVSESCEDVLLTLLIRKLQSALSSIENFPVILSHAFKPRNSYVDIPVRRCTVYPCLKVRFVKEEGDQSLCAYDDVLTVEACSSFKAIERFLWPKISKRKADHRENQVGDGIQTNASSERKCFDMLNPELVHKSQESWSSSSEGLENKEMADVAVDGSSPPIDVATETASNVSCTEEKELEDGIAPVSSEEENARNKLVFFLEGKKLDHSVTLYQAILEHQIIAEPDLTLEPKFWSEVYNMTYRRAELELNNPEMSHRDSFSSFWKSAEITMPNLSFSPNMFLAELQCSLDKSNPLYDLLFLLKALEALNRNAFHLLTHERINAFAEGEVHNLDDLKVVVSLVPRSEFTSIKLTDKLEQQMRDPLALTAVSMPLWCTQLMALCPFLFSFETRRKYFHLTVLGPSRTRQNLIHYLYNLDTDSLNERRLSSSSPSRKKFKVDRSAILDSAAKMMASHSRTNASIEIEYIEEVGTGLGPTMEFYTLISHEFQKVGLGMWRGDQRLYTVQLHFGSSKVVEGSGFVVAPFGLFPRPWALEKDPNGIDISLLIKKFFLLGQLVAKAIKDGRILDIPFSRAFYKLILDQELGIYDIQSFDPDLGRTLLEFQAIVKRKKFLESVSEEHSKIASELCLRSARIEDLYLDFTLPGYSDYLLGPESNSKMVNIDNLEEYVSLAVDATVRTGILRQLEAFKSGFNEVLPLPSLQIFTEDELERLLCGEKDTWHFNDLLDHVKFDHGYTASSPPVTHLLDIIQEFGCVERRAFLQFVTGAPRLPPGGLAALNPKLTIVRKHCSSLADMDLPSVMTCANYLKLPPYSSKDIMKQKLEYAITEGQGSFHLS